MTFFKLLQEHSSKMATVEAQGCRLEVVRRGPLLRRSSVVSEVAIALAKAGLGAGLEVRVFDRD